MGGSTGILTPIMEPLFGKAPEPPEAKPLPEVPEISDNKEADKAADEAVKKRRIASAKSGRQSTVLGSFKDEQAPEIAKKTLLGQ